MKKWFILTLLLGMMFSTPLIGAMAGNESCKIFSTPNPCDTGNKSAGLDGALSPNIGWLIAEGGGNLLKSASDFNRFAGVYELSENVGLDFKALQASLNDAIANMEKAKEIYRQLKDLASVTPYNPIIVDRLNQFDYDTFGKERGLIGDIFREAQSYLSVGDVRGIYKEFHNRAVLLLERLYTLKRDADAYINPGLSCVWRANQMYSEFKLFGQYVAEVFHALP